MALAVLAVAGAVAGCAGPRPLAYSPDAIRVLVRARVPELPPSEIVVPYEVDEEFVATARRAIRHSSNGRDKVVALAESLASPRWFDLRYEWAASGSAAETIESGVGNCLSLSSVFIGLARELGMDAYYIDATREPERRQEGAVIISAGHIAVGVSTSSGVILVDFSGQLRPYASFRKIDDLEALGHLYNNRGYQLIHRAQSEGEPIPWEDVRDYFSLATRVSPGFAMAWNNLGIAHGHLGDRAEAERTYHAAIARDPKLSAPHINLASMYLERGELGAALAGLDRAERLDRRNPFVHYMKGVALVRIGYLNDAEAALSRSLRLKDDLKDARVLLAEVRRRMAHEAHEPDSWSGPLRDR